MFLLTRHHQPLLLAALLLALPISHFCVAEEQAAKPREELLVTLTSGERFEAEFAGVDQQGQLLFQQGGEPRKINPQNLVQWGVASELPVDEKFYFYLADGSLIRGELLQLNKDALQIRPATFLDTQASVSSVRAVIVLPPNTPVARRKMLTSIDEATGVQDRIILKNGDEISGVLLKIGAYIESIKTQKIEFRSRGATRSLMTRNVSAVVFNPVLLRKPALAGQHTWMTFRDGSRLLVSQAVSDGAGLVTLTLACGVNLFVDEEQFAKELQMIQPTGGRAKFLSEMKPLAYRHTPFLSIPWPMHLDANAGNGPLRTGAGVYLRGIGMHSRSRVAFPLGGKYKRFLTSLAIDKIAGRRGSVEFRVYLNRGGAWKPAYESGVIRGGQPPVHVSLDIDKAAAMLLIVDFADRGDEMDFANWLNACVVAE